ncbi:MAG TPA: DNA repair protein RecN [Lachnospiraceae bacterium]|nr:DNA repair protein RecN [Lachnospiraceae bacterium]
MLINLHVKNVALIDDVELDLREGLNILTGETGAGKSLIIDAVNFALGKRMKSDVIRDEADHALCELTFTVDSDEIRDKLNELMIPCEDNTVIIKRKLMNGRSIIRINDESASAATLKDLAAVLIDIHGQHEHQSLLYKSKHKQILDSYCGDPLTDITDKLSLLYKDYMAVKAELEDALTSGRDTGRAMELARFEVDEIMRAGIKEGEIEALESEYRRLSNSKRIAESVDLVHRISGYDDEAAAGSQIGRALSRLRGALEYDPALKDLCDELADIDGLLNDFNRALAGYEDSLDSSGERFLEVEERLNLVNHIRDRYGDTLEDINDYLKKQQEMVDKYSDFEAYTKGLKKKAEDLRGEVLKLSCKASEIRTKEAQVLSSEIKEALLDLNFLDVRFEIKVVPDEEKLTSSGYDSVEFLISTNPGEKMRPLNEVASGGELSRIMLALKTVLADKDSVGTLIFDEIDTGISGRTAQKVSEKLKQLSGKRQVICITHLPQIAAMADDHFLISKEVKNERTVTEVVRLDEEASVRELARMLGGVSITENTLKSAKEMKMLAINII